MPDQILYLFIVIVLLVVLVKLVTMFVYTGKEKRKAKNLISIAIVDNHKLFRKGISLALTSQNFQIILEASGGKEIVDLLNRNINPDIALVSTHLDGMDATETIKLLQEYNPEIKILVLYMDPLHERPEKMIEAGANGCIAKTAEPEEIKIAILEILNKGFYRPQRRYAYRALNNF